MPLPTSSVARTPQHIRNVFFRSFERADGLWDIEGELFDTKAIDQPHPGGRGERKAGEPIHHMHIRATVNTQLVVQAITVAMDAHPLGHCPSAMAALQRMVGCSMARGWRKAIDAHLGGIASCTHLRELLNPMATAAFQSIVSNFQGAPGQPDAFLGRCAGWDFNGPGVATYFPQFVGWRIPGGKGPALPPALHTPDAPPSPMP